MIFETERLVARPWTMSDLESAFNIYGDPVVGRFIGGHVADIDAQRERLALYISRTENWSPRGMGGWALELKGCDVIVGSALLKPIPFSADYNPAPEEEDIEVGWHLAQEHWGYGYASEAAAGALTHGFDKLGLERIVAVVNPENERSLRVAERLGMRRLPDTNRYYEQSLALFEMMLEDWIEHGPPRIRS